MSSFTVIADAGESLAKVLWEEIDAEGDVAITDLVDSEQRISLESPVDLKDDQDVRLSLYLYRVVENAYMKNRPPVPGAVGSLRKPPLSLDLSYLVTPLLGTPREQHIVLGKVTEVFYDRAILEGTDLVGSLTDAGQQLRVVLNPASLEESTRIWNALDLPYRLSVCYDVRVVMIDSREAEALHPVVQRDTDYAGIESAPAGS